MKIDGHQNEKNKHAERDIINIPHTETNNNGVNLNLAMNEQTACRKCQDCMLTSIHEKKHAGHQHQHPQRLAEILNDHRRTREKFAVECENVKVKIRTFEKDNLVRIAAMETKLAQAVKTNCLCTMFTTFITTMALIIFIATMTNNMERQNEMLHTDIVKNMDMHREIESLSIKKDRVATVNDLKRDISQLLTNSNETIEKKLNAMEKVMKGMYDNRRNLTN